MLRKLTATSATWAMLPLRLALGVIFIAHGAQKVFGTWEGPGLRAFMNFPAPYPFMRPAWLWMGAAAFAELVGGILVLLGLFTRLGAFLIFCVMLTAMLWLFGQGLQTFFPQLLKMKIDVQIYAPQSAADFRGERAPPRR